MSRPAPPITQSPAGQGKGVAKLPRQPMPQERRQALSEMARERHQNSEGHGFGRGLVKKGSKPKRKHVSKKRASEKVAEAAREKRNALAITEVFKDGIAPHQPMNIRLKAAEAWIKVEQDDAKLRLREEDVESMKKDRAELLDTLSQGLSQGYTAAILRRKLSGQTEHDDNVIEGTIVSEETNGS